MRRKRTGLFSVALLVLTLVFSGCGTQEEKDPFVKLEFENGDSIVMELYPEIAPMTVKHFMENIKSKYYNGKVFHRAVDGFMIQGGSSDGFGRGGTGRTVQGEFSENGVQNDLKHTRGIVSMARSQDMNSASGQFFIMQGDAPHLDGKYAAFGKVVEGMDVVDKIAKQPTRGVQKDELVDKPVIKSVTVLKNYTPPADSQASPENTASAAPGGDQPAGSASPSATPAA